MYVALALLAVFVIAAVLMWLQGAWNNAVTLINLMLAGLIATSFFEPVADAAQKEMNDYRYLLDFICLWGLFAISFLILRAVTDAVAGQWVELQPTVEQVGRAALALVNAWVLVSFAAMTLHTAPIPASPGGELSGPDDTTMFIASPDAHWIGFARFASRYGLSGNATFDDDGTFRARHYHRREAFAGSDGFLVN